MKKRNDLNLNKYNSKVLDKYLTQFYVHATGSNDYGCHKCYRIKEILLELLSFNYVKGFSDGRKEGLTWKGIIRSKKIRIPTFCYMKIIWIIEDLLDKITHKFKGWLNARPKR